MAGVKGYSLYMALEHFNYILQTMCILQFRNLFQKGGLHQVNLKCPFGWQIQSVPGF